MGGPREAIPETLADMPNRAQVDTTFKIVNRIVKSTTSALKQSAQPDSSVAGYTISYGRPPAALDNVVSVANPDVTTYQVTDLSPGTWYFAIAAYSSRGEQGVLS